MDRFSRARGACFFDFCRALRLYVGGGGGDMGFVAKPRAAAVPSARSGRQVGDVVSAMFISPP